MNKKCCVTLILAFLFFSQCNFLISQDSGKVTLPNESMLKKGNWAIIFEAGTIFGSSNFFESFNLTAKKHFSDCFALRLSAGVSINESNGPENISNLSSGNFPASSNLSKSTDGFITTLNFQYFLSVNHKIKPFLSFGPYAAYSYSRQNSSSYIYKSDEWAAGFFSSFGVEMFILDNISIIGEYIMKGTYGKKLYKSIDLYDALEDYSYSSVYKLEFKNARLGFSVYF